MIKTVTEMKANATKQQPNPENVSKETECKRKKKKMVEKTSKIIWMFDSDKKKNLWQHAK